jgi:hypothetical protein
VEGGELALRPFDELRAGRLKAGSQQSRYRVQGIRGTGYRA